MPYPLISDNDGRPVITLGVQWIGLSTLEKLESLSLLERWIAEQRVELRKEKERE